MWRAQHGENPGLDLCFIYTYTDSCPRTHREETRHDRPGPPSPTPPPPTPACVPTLRPPSPSPGDVHRLRARELSAQLPERLQLHLRPATEIPRPADADRDDHLPTSVPGFDRLLGGGLARGTVLELVGRGSCGRLGVVLATLAVVTRTGESAALVDRGGHLDPRAAASAGVDLERVLWVRPSRLHEAVTAAEMLVVTGFPLVAVDLGLPPIRGRATPAAWLRLARACAERRAVVLVASPYRVSGCAAATVLCAGRGRGRWVGSVPGPRLLEGLATPWHSTRRRGHRTEERITTTLWLPEVWTETRPDHSDVEEVHHVEAL